MKNKEAFVSASVVYQSVGGGVPVSVCSGRTKVTVLANGGKAHPYHKADGSVWD